MAQVRMSAKDGVTVRDEPSDGVFIPECPIEQEFRELPYGSTAWVKAAVNYIFSMQWAWHVRLTMGSWPSMTEGAVCVMTPREMC